MKRREFTAGILTLLATTWLAAAPALAAATFVEQVVGQLRAQGFEDIEVETTLLGRTRIAATRADGNREIVLNPTSGEILRDLWLSKTGDATGQINIGDDGHKGTGSGSGDDSGDGDDHGGNSGSGGGGGEGGGSGGGGGGGDGGGGGEGDGDDD